MVLTPAGRGLDFSGRASATGGPRMGAILLFLEAVLVGWQRRRAIGTPPAQRGAPFHSGMTLVKQERPAVILIADAASDCLLCSICCQLQSTPSSGSGPKGWP